MSGVCTALADPATRRAFRRHHRRCLGMVGVGVAVWGASDALLAVADDPTRPPVQALSLPLLSAGAVAVGGGIAALATCWRIWWVLRSHPWTEWECAQPAVSPDRSPVGASVHLGPAGEHRLILVTYLWRRDRVAGAGTVWLAGSPERGGVLSPEGGMHLVHCRPAGRPRRPFRNGHTADAASVCTT